MDVVRKKILLIIPNLGMGGAQRSFAKLANWLCETYDVKAVCFDIEDKTDYPLNAEICALGTSSGNNFWSKFLTAVHRLKRLNEIKREWRPDASISFLEGADYLNLLTRTREPKLLSVRGSKKYDPNIKGIFGWVRRSILIPFLYRRSRLIIAVSIGIEQELKTDYPRLSQKLVTITNGFKLQPIPETNRRGDNFIIGWAGRFSFEKGLLEWCSLFADLQRQNSFYRLLLLGFGTQQKEAKKILQSRGLRVKECTYFDEKDFENVEVIICRPGNNYENYLSKCHLFVFTSPSEGFGNVLVEAMQCGLPVVSTDSNWGPREILATGLDYKSPIEYPSFQQYGILAPILKGDKNTYFDAWALSIQRMSVDKELRDTYKAKLMECVARFDEEKIKQMWIEKIEACMQKNI